jgi:hypothetical protein
MSRLPINKFQGIFQQSYLFRFLAEAAMIAAAGAIAFLLRFEFDIPRAYVAQMQFCGSAVGSRQISGFLYLSPRSLLVEVLLRARYVATGASQFCWFYTERRATCFGCPSQLPPPGPFQFET